MALFDFLTSSDPNSQAQTALAAGLLSGHGSFNQILGASLLNSQKTQDELQNAEARRKLMAAQQQDIQQQIQQRALQVQQANAMWDLQRPIFEQLSNRAKGVQTPQQPSQMSTSSMFTPEMNAARQGMPATPMSGQTSGQSQGGSVFPGISDQAGMYGFALAGPAEVGKSILSAGAPTDVMKAAGAIYGKDTPEYQQAIKDWVGKQGYIPPTPLRTSMYIDPKTGDVKQVPAPLQGSMWVKDPTNPSGFSYIPIGGAGSAIAARSRAESTGTAEVTPSVAYTPEGKPIFSTKLQDVLRAQGWTPPSGVAPNDVAPSAAATGTAGNNYGPDTLALLKTERLKAVATGSAQDVASIDKEIARITPLVNSAPPQNVTPVPVPGTPEYKAGQGKAASDRATQVRTAASDSPMRVNVLDHVIQLADKSGPGQDFMNNLLGYAAYMPGLGALKGDVSDFQEMKKFMAQNGMRAWTAAGGTGTDTQLEAAMSTQPNSKMFPQAVKTIGAWAKAGELAIQAKAQAQDKWLQDNGDTPQQQAKFESTWRSNWDPTLFNLKTMAPDEAKATVDKMKLTNPAQYKSLMDKAQKLRDMGAM